MAKIEKIERFLKEEKPKKEKDLEVGFDIESFEKEEDVDTLGFRSEFEPITKGEEKTLKKEIQVTTPGLKKSIKKFEDFKISISVDEVAPEEDVVMGGLEPNEEESCVGCECNPCECVSTSDDSEKVVRFEDFLKNIM